MTARVVVAGVALAAWLSAAVSPASAQRLAGEPTGVPQPCGVVLAAEKVRELLPVKAFGDVHLAAVAARSIVGYIEVISARRHAATTGSSTPGLPCQGGR